MFHCCRHHTLLQFQEHHQPRASTHRMRSPGWHLQTRPTKPARPESSRTRGTRRTWGRGRSLLARHMRKQLQDQAFCCMIRFSRTTHSRRLWTGKNRMLVACDTDHPGNMSQNALHRTHSNTSACPGYRHSGTVDCTQSKWGRSSGRHMHTSTWSH